MRRGDRPGHACLCWSWGLLLHAGPTQPDAVPPEAFVPDDDGFVTRNGSNGFDALFSDRGLQVQPRRRDLGLHPRARPLGPARRRCRAAPAAPDDDSGPARPAPAGDHRVVPEQRRPRPGARLRHRGTTPGRGALTLELATGGLTPAWSAIGSSWPPTHGGVLAYDGLVVVDAYAGHALPSALGVEGDHVTVAVDDRCRHLPGRRRPAAVHARGRRLRRRRRLRQPRW